MSQLKENVGSVGAEPGIHHRELQLDGGHGDCGYYSFRISFDHWLGKLLPADLQLREPFGNDTAHLSKR